MKKLLLFLAFIFSLSHSFAQERQIREKTIRVRYNENSQKLVASDPGYMVLSYDMYLYTAQGSVIGPCTVDRNKDDPESLYMFYQRVQPGDKVRMKNIKVLDIATKKMERVADYSVVLR